MRKTYRYRNLSYAVADDKEVYFSIHFVSDGNTSQTVINIPGDNDPDIENEGTCLLGKGKELRGDTTIVFSDIANPVPQEDEIRLQYKINDQLLVEHLNSKSDEERPIVVLFINFPVQ